MVKQNICRKASYHHREQHGCQRELIDQAQTHDDAFKRCRCGESSFEDGADASYCHKWTVIALALAYV